MPLRFVSAHATPPTELPAAAWAAGAVTSELDASSEASRVASTTRRLGAYAALGEVGDVIR